MKELLKRFITEEEGQGLTEYALIVGFVVFAIWLAVTQTDIGRSISNMFNNVADEIDACAGGGGNCTT